MKPVIHFAHANGVPSKVYQKLFDGLKDEYDIIYVPLLGPDKRYPIDNHWNSLTNQVIDSIVRQANGSKVIGLGHSLGSVLTFQAALKRPELFQQVIMIDPPLIMGKDGFALHVAKTLRNSPEGNLIIAYFSSREFNCAKVPAERTIAAPCPGLSSML